ncbi:MAG: ABC transporter ATP-binding protein [Spirochaetales bacterium]|nr:ABC transporter ATP-binding protein [Spirochaetales bacterium]
MDNGFILEVRGLITSFKTEAGKINAVEDVGFSLRRGKTLGLVGESGCGKSVTALSVMRLLPKPAGTIEGGSVVFDGEDLLRLPPDAMHRIRGKRISMIFQEPMTALNPIQRVGKQLDEVYLLHNPGVKKETAKERSVGLLKEIGLPDPEKRYTEYPHQLSGGMRQRVMIAMAISCEPEILIADEPTTALDVTIQAQILDIIRRLQETTGMSIIFITHDLGVIAEVCDDVVVMYAGKIAETASAVELFSNPRHPYTMGLLSSIPRLENERKITLPVIEGRVPSLYELPEGCRFQNRCPYVMDICRKDPPPLFEMAENHYASCYYAEKQK